MMDGKTYVKKAQQQEHNKGGGVLLWRVCRPGVARTRTARECRARSTRELNSVLHPTQLRIALSTWYPPGIAYDIVRLLFQSWL